MTDTRHLLERARDAAPATAPDLQHVYRRSAVRSGRSRVAAAVVALTIAGGGMAIVFDTLVSSQDRPAAGSQIGEPTQELHLGEDQFYYQRFDEGYGVCVSWWALDDSGVLARSDSDPQSGSCWGPQVGAYGPGQFYSDSGPVDGLSTDSDELKAQLLIRVEPGGASPEPYEDWGGPVEWGLIRSIRELLQAPDVTPEQKAALMIVASELSTSVDTHAQDPEGRPAILLTLDSEGQTHRWWFDPESHQPLAMDAFVVQAAGVVGTVESSDLDRAFVPAVRQ